MSTNEDPHDFVEHTRAASDAGTPTPEESIWSSDEAFDSLQMERQVHGDEKPEDLAQRMLKEAAPGAAASIIHIAMQSANDNTRLAASRYVVDLAREAEGQGAGGWEDILAGAISKVEEFANMPSQPTPESD